MVWHFLLVTDIQNVMTIRVRVTSESSVDVEDLGSSAFTVNHLFSQLSNFFILRLRKKWLLLAK